jgi:hypothetical protein
MADCPPGVLDLAAPDVRQMRTHSTPAGPGPLAQDGW